MYSHYNCTFEVKDRGERDECASGFWFSAVIFFVVFVCLRKAKSFGFKIESDWRALGKCQCGTLSVYIKQHTSQMRFRELLSINST